MTTISIQELQLHPDKLVDRLVAGEHFILLRDGQAVAELRPLSCGSCTSRPYGLAAGQFAVPDDFDSALPSEVLNEFEGR